MFDLLHESFARHGDSFFLRKDRGVLIVPEAFLKNEYEEIQKNEQFLYEEGQKVFEVAKQNVLENAGSEVCHSLSLTQDLPNETLLLTEKTTVTLSNIEISAKLFFVLLEKTKITIGERFSITKHVDNEDCIRDHDMAREAPFYLSGGVVSRLALENIERMPPSSIGCSLKEIRLYRTGLINIFSKLRINKDSEVKCIGLSAREKENVAAILPKDHLIYIGGVKRLFLENYAVSVLPKLRIHEGHELKLLKLAATEEEYVATILAQDHPFCVGRVKEMEFWDYAVFVFLKIKEVGEGPEGLLLSIYGDGLWKKIHEELGNESTTICIEEVEKLVLKEHAVNILPTLKIKEEMDTFSLDANNEEQVSEVLSEEYKGISFGRIKDFGLFGSAVNLLPKIRLGEDSEVEQYSLFAAEKRQISNVLGKEDRSISTGRVKNMELTGYAVCVIPKLRIHEDNIMERFLVSTNELYFSRILSEGDSSIEVGKIRQVDFRVTKKLKRKLRYTLVDGEGNEVHEEKNGEGSEAVGREVNEVLEERSCQRRNHLD
ncbi:MAG: uncharacterized protein A8A55_2028 [Amphiamblys sp. WSBS2006]|nr:MAG: uncharacterized protein A8A55_2028 [Amphiamblys sp. WSBS2006]